MKTFATLPRAEPQRERPCALCSSSSFKPLWRLEGFSFVGCRGCGLIQQNPQPLREAVLARYDESYLAYEAERQFAYRDLERLGLADLGFEAETAGLRAGAAAAGLSPRILDVGCATGALLVSLRDEGWSCLGVEACKPAAAYGRERYGLDIRGSTLEEAKLEPSSFEVIHASHLIEHLNDPLAFLREVSRLLAPGGILLLTTPNAAGFQARLLGRAWRSAIYDHLYLFSAANLRALLAKAGFRVERFATWGGWAEGLKPSFIKAPLDRLAKKWGFGDVMAVLAKKTG